MTATPQASTEGAPLPRTAAARLPKPMRRVLLLGAAREVFVSQGYHAAAMDEIAERAGVSKPVLYQHFTNKRGLYLALLDESVADLVGAVSAALESTTDNRQRVEATFHAFFDYIGGTGGAFRLIFESDLANEPDVRDRLDLAMRDCAAMVSEFIAADAGVSNAEADLLGMALVGMAQVIARYWLRTKRPLPQDIAENLLSKLAWRGISGWPLADSQQDQPDQHPVPVLPD